MNAGVAGGRGLAQAASMGADQKQTILSVMKELTNNNRFIHKNDIFNVLRGKMQ